MIKTVRVGPFDYTIRPLDPQVATERNILGEHKPLDLEITVLEEMAVQRRVEVLWHEILHAMWLASGLTEHIPAELEEKIVNSLGLQIAQVFRDNPHLLRATMRALK